MVQVITSIDGLRAAVGLARRRSETIGFVPTMGALHEGHLSLVRACAAACAFRVVSIFVNPTQFGPQEDFSRYPRDLANDLAALEPHNVQLVFAPATDDIYPPGFATQVQVGRITERLEGRCRPGHFAGVALVVLKLFNLVTPDVAYFGQKDYQQFLVIRRLTKDLDLPIQIRTCPTVREPDGLALSSRNAYLSPQERTQALCLIHGLELAEQMLQHGTTSAKTIRQGIQSLFDQHQDVKTEYIALVDPDNLTDVEEVAAPTLVAVAAYVGRTRLIDNAIVGRERAAI